jgi:hypothetical protein
MDTSAEDLRFKKVAQHLLQLDMGIIPSTVLHRKIDIDAANLLVQHGLFIYREDLLVENDEWDSDGYIKLIPEGMDIKFAHGSECNFKCTVHVFNDGRCFIVSLNRKIFHRVGERYSRPIRGSRRQRIKEKFKASGSVYRVHAEYDQHRTRNEKRGFNYDATGKSKKVFKKIKAESVSESLLSPDFQIGMYACILEVFT